MNLLGLFGILRYPSPLTGEGQGGGEKMVITPGVFDSPTPLSPPTRGGETICRTRCGVSFEIGGKADERNSQANH